MTESSKDGAEAQTNSKKALRWIGLIAAGLIGWAGSRALGGTFWIPLLSVVITWAVLDKLKVPKRLVPALAITIGHCIWIVSGTGIMAMMARATTEQMVLGIGEFVVVALLVLWILKKQSVFSLGTLIAFDVIGIASVLISGAEHQGVAIYVLIHAGLRVAAIIAAIYAMVVGRRGLPA